MFFLLLIFLAFRFGYLTPVEQALFDGPFSQIYSIRAYAQVFLLAAINITVLSHWIQDYIACSSSVWIEQYAK